jgi:hypothetical protein
VFDLIVEVIQVATLVHLRLELVVVRVLRLILKILTVVFLHVGQMIQLMF